MLLRSSVVCAVLLAASCATSTTNTTNTTDTVMAAPAMPTFTARLSGAQEVPPTATTGSGTATMTIDPATRVLTYRVEYSGLTGPVGAAHIHGPAAEGANAPPIIPFTMTASPITGTATLTEAQVADLQAGRTCVNLHTAAHRGGEIRGQITR